MTASKVNSVAEETLTGDVNLSQTTPTSAFTLNSANITAKYQNLQANSETINSPLKKRKFSLAAIFTKNHILGSLAIGAILIAGIQHFSKNTTAVINTSTTETPLLMATSKNTNYANDILKKLPVIQKEADTRQAKLDSSKKPLYVAPTKTAGIITSYYGNRWGAIHGGIDIANPIGTPIYAVADGTVISAGPAQGFGLWVRIQHAGGIMTVYGHVNTIEVSVGQHVTAGDEIATVGNRGFSTGPHLHFETWINGVRSDPIPWLIEHHIFA